MLPEHGCVHVYVGLLHDTKWALRSRKRVVFTHKEQLSSNDLPPLDSVRQFFCLSEGLFFIACGVICRGLLQGSPKDFS